MFKRFPKKPIFFLYMFLIRVFVCLYCMDCFLFLLLFIHSLENCNTVIAVECKVHQILSREYLSCVIGAILIIKSQQNKTKLKKRL